MDSWLRERIPEPPIGKPYFTSFSPPTGTLKQTDCVHVLWSSCNKCRAHFQFSHQKIARCILRTTQNVITVITNITIYRVVTQPTYRHQKIFKRPAHISIYLKYFLKVKGSSICRIHPGIITLFQWYCSSFRSITAWPNTSFLCSCRIILLVAPVVRWKVTSEADVTVT